MLNIRAKNIDAFILVYPEPVRKKLEQIRQAVHRIAPEAEEAIRYGIPTFQLNGNMLHFAAYETHIGFYPGPSGIDAFGELCRPFRTGKGTLQFPLDSPLPMALIRDIIRFRTEQQRQRKSSPKKKLTHVCKNGHQFVRTAACRVCPTCEAERNGASPWAALPTPARRALENAGVRTLKQLAGWHEQDLLALHGLGPSSLPKIRKLIRDSGKK